MIDSLRLNVFQDNSRSFRLEDDLYFADSLFHDGQQRYGVHHASPLKVEICFFLFCYHGKSAIRINQQDYVLDENDVLIAMPGSILEKIDIDESNEVILLAFDRDTIPHNIRVSGMATFLSKSYQILSSVCTLSAERMENFKLFYTASRNLLISEQDKDIQANIIQGFAYITIGILEGWIHSEESSVSGNASRSQRIVSAFMTDIRHYAITQRKVSFYAARAALSPKYFSRLIIHQTGKRPLDHIYDYLVLEAKCKLSSGRHTIKQIADYLNFSGTSAFTRFFRTKTGLTPAEFMATQVV